jgi:hypothetical protein
VIAALVVRQDQNWLGFAIVMGILLFSLGAWLRYLKVEEGGRELLEWLRSLGPDIESDHVECASDECDQVICRCRKPAECVGTTTLGCVHEGLCWDCRLGCRECLAEARAEQDLAWEGGR